MLDAQTQSYLELSWVAGLLGMTLDRVASGDPEEGDAKAIKEAADAMEGLLSEGEVSEVEGVESAFPLFATAEGLDVTLSTIEPEELQGTARELRKVSQALDSGSTDQPDIKKDAERLRDIFFRLERQAEAKAAMSKMGTHDSSQIYSQAES